MVKNVEKKGKWVQEFLRIFVFFASHIKVLLCIYISLLSRYYYLLLQLFLNILSLLFSKKYIQLFFLKCSLFKKKFPLIFLNIFSHLFKKKFTTLEKKICIYTFSNIISILHLQFSVTNPTWSRTYKNIVWFHHSVSCVCLLITKYIFTIHKCYQIY